MCHIGGISLSTLANMFKSAISGLEALTDNRKDPLHVGEVMACWTYLAFVEHIITYESVGLNTTTHKKLKSMFEEAIKTAQGHRKQLSQFMREQGVALPRAPELKPKSDQNAIPLGAKFTDSELVNTLNTNFVIAADMCAAAASQCLRTDVGLMFLKFQADKLALGFRTKELMQKEGWLNLPPYYQPPGSLSKTSSK